MIGAHGVPLKHFERVASNILPTVQPEYSKLPPPLDNDNQWPWSTLPVSARPFGSNPGQLKSPERAARKEGQISSLFRCILRLIPEDNPCCTIVDFGGGSGHLGVPLSLLLPRCRIIVVDLRKKSLDLMHEKADLVVHELIEKHGRPQKSLHAELPSFVEKNPAFRSCGKNGHLENLFSFHGPVEKYAESFDIALALHLCGEATDVTLRKAASVQASAIVVAPCCVGKLSKKVLNPDVYHATGENMATVSYPQSSVFCQLIKNQDDWDALVKSADYSNEQESRTSRNATRRASKALLETDRRIFLEEKYQYKTALMRMDPWEVTPKNDILVAWKLDSFDSDVFLNPDADCQADIEVAKSHLLFSSNIERDGARLESSDWSFEEEKEITASIQTFLDSTDGMEDKMNQVFIFPTRMGGRKRKLIHYVAGKLKLAHWCEGNKDSEKTVAVARRGQRKRNSRKSLLSPS